MIEGNLTPEEQHALKLREETARIAKEEAAALQAQANAAKTQSEIEKLKVELEAARQKAEDDRKAAERAARVAEQEEAPEAEKRQAERLKAIGEAEKATQAALFPRGETKPLEGKIEMDDKAGYMADLVAHKALETCAASIGASIDALPDIATKTVLVVESLDFSRGDLVRIQTCAHIEAFTSAMTALRPQLEVLFTKAIPGPSTPTPPAGPKPSTGMGIEGTELPAPTAVATAGAGLLATTIMGLGNPVTLGLTAAVSGISLAADVASYFLTDYSIKGRQLAISSETVMATISGALKKPKVHIFGFRRIEESDVLKKFVALLAEQAVLAGQAERVRLKLEYTAKLKETIAALQKTAAKTENQAEKAAVLVQVTDLSAELHVLATDVAAADVAVQLWKSTSASLEAFAKTTSIVPTGAKLSPIAIAALMESLADPEIDCLLWVKAGSVGSETMTERSRFPWWNGRSTYFGGVAVSFVLAEKTGAVLLADTKVAMRRVKYLLWDGKVDASGDINLDEMPS